MFQYKEEMYISACWDSIFVEFWSLEILQHIQGPYFGLTDILFCVKIYFKSGSKFSDDSNTDSFCHVEAYAADFILKTLQYKEKMLILLLPQCLKI